MSDDLVERLRSSTQFYHADCELKMACAYRIEELEAKHTELVSAVSDLLHDVRLSILDEGLSDGEGYELWEEVKKFRRVIHAAGLAELKGQDGE
jgi:hypothetical protein